MRTVLAQKHAAEPLIESINRAFRRVLGTCPIERFSRNMRIFQRVLPFLPKSPDFDKFALILSSEAEFTVMLFLARLERLFNRLFLF